MHKILNVHSDKIVSTETTKNATDGFLIAVVVVTFVALFSFGIGYMVSQKQTARDIALTHTTVISDTGYVCTVMPHDQ